MNQNTCAGQGLRCLICKKPINQHSDAEFKFCLGRKFLQDDINGRWRNSK